MDNYTEDILELFNEDIKEKKKTSTGARNKGNCTSSSLSWHNFGMPKGYLSRKEQEQLGGEVMTYNMKKDISRIKSYDEVMKMPKNKGREYILELRKNFLMKDLLDHWKKNSWYVYNKMFKKFGIETGKMPFSKEEIKEQVDDWLNPKKGNQQTIYQIKDFAEVEEDEPETKEESTTMVEMDSAPTVVTDMYIKEQLKKNTFNITLGGEFTATELSKRIKAVSDMITLFEEDSKFEMVISINEITE